MCGIIGALGKLPERKKFEKARDLLSHRGPDDHGVYYHTEERAALGFRRLSIIDLSDAGHQPFFSNDGRFVLVFNGEIYNYLEIRDELKNGYEFKTQTDTEVLLAVYIRWGERCVEKCNGMFAFAIWDKKEKKLFCARDRLGIKPFFYYTDGNSFLFSSEIKALLALDVPRTPNNRIIFDYLYYGFYDHSDATFFDKVQRLPAGAVLTLKDGALQIKKYWDLAETEPVSAHLSDAEIKDTFKNLLANAINIRFRSDVPVGIGLSSGLDSSTLFYYAKNVLGKKPSIFSECAESDEYNECSIIERSIPLSGKSLWHTCSLSPTEIFSAADSLNRIQGEPYAGIPIMGTSKRYKMVREKGTIVLLDGEGPDELLCGYKYYEMDVLNDRKGLTHPTKSSLDYGQDMTTLTPRNILSRDFVARHKGAGLQFKKPFSSHLLNAQYRDIVYTKIPRVLRFKDHASMAHSIELRVPYLDYRFVEFCFFLPLQYKIRGEIRKVLLRDVMQGVLPESTRGTGKKAFGAIQTEWFRKYYRDYLLSITTSPSFRSRGYWNDAELNKEIDDFYAGKGNNSFFLWQCVNLELWFRAFID